MSYDEPLKLVVAGLGRRIATVIRHLHAATPVEIAGYCDPDPIGLAAVREAGILVGPAHASVPALLDSVPADLLMVGSPNHLHLEHIGHGLAAGIRVFTEKPVVRTESETFELARLLRAHGEDQVLVGLVLRSAPLVQAVVAYLDSGRLGTMISFEANEHLHPEHGAFLSRDWRRHGAHGGSYLLDKCCHDFDLYRRFTSALPRRVTSFGGRRIFTPDQKHLQSQRYRGGEPAYSLWPAGWAAQPETFGSDGDAMDHQVALIEYMNGVQLAFHSNTHSGILQRRWLFCGTEGALEADLVSNRLTFRHALGLTKSEVREFDGQVSNHYGSDPQMGRDLAAHLRDGAPFRSNVYDAMVAGLTVMAIDRAMASGTVVDCTGLWTELHQALGRASSD